MRGAPFENACGPEGSQCHTHHGPVPMPLGAGCHPVLAQVPSEKTSSEPPVPGSAWSNLPGCVCCTF